MCRICVVCQSLRVKHKENSFIKQISMMCLFLGSQRECSTGGKASSRERSHSVPTSPPYFTLTSLKGMGQQIIQVSLSNNEPKQGVFSTRSLSKNCSVQELTLLVTTGQRTLLLGRLLPPRWQGTATSLAPATGGLVCAQGFTCCHIPTGWALLLSQTVSFSSPSPYPQGVSVQTTSSTNYFLFEKDAGS